MPLVVRDLLTRTSRTFALAIPLLPEPTQTALALAYLLFRVADTLEDAAQLSRDDRVAALEELIPILQNRDAPRAEEARSRWLSNEVTHDDGNRELLVALPLLLEYLSTWEPARARIVLEHAARTAEGMAQTLREANAAGHVRLTSLPALRRYCYAVAGIVGELVTALFVFDVPELAAIRPTLALHDRAFGEALQLVNILKDERADAEDGRVYVPAGVSRQWLTALARADLVQANAYIRALADADAPAGFVAFTSLPVELAQRTLMAVEHCGSGAKVPREEVLALLTQVQSVGNAQTVREASERAR